MKTIIATAIALTIATSVSANMGTGTATWGGNSGTVHGNGNCQFKKNQPGVMSFDGVDTWNVTTNAVVVLKTRGVNNAKVIPEGAPTGSGVTKLYQGDTAVADVTVNYAPKSTVSVNGKNDASTNANTNSLTAGNLKKNSGVTKVTFSIGGKATMSGDAVLDMDDNTNYTINHTVTCLQ